MSERGTGSLEVLAEEVRAEREAQQRFFDALDSKAGVMLGFAGALTALAPTDTNLVVDIGRAVAVTGGIAALWAFWPRSYGVPALRSLREDYLSADPRFTRRTLLDSYLVNIDELSDALQRKVRRIKMAMSGIIASALLVAIGSAVD